MQKDHRPERKDLVLWGAAIGLVCVAVAALVFVLGWLPTGSPGKSEPSPSPVPPAPVTVPSPPSSPTELRTLQLSATHLEISWDAVANADKYYVQWSQPGGVTANRFDTRDTRARIENLQPGKEYVVVVRAANTGGESSDSPGITVQTYLTWDEVFARNRAGIAKVTGYPTDLGILESGRCGGTGFFITQYLAVTNYHVGECAKSYLKLWVQGPDGKEYPQAAQVMAVDKPNDLALISLPADARVLGVPLIFADPPLMVGQALIVVGHPGGQSVRYSQGSFDGVRKDVLVNQYGTIPEMLHITAAAIGGNSGGPVIDGYGQIVGIVAASSPTNQNDTYAIPARRLTRLLEQITRGR